MTGTRASTIGNANELTKIPMVMKMAASRQLLLDPEPSLYLLAINVGMGARR